MQGGREARIERLVGRPCFADYGNGSLAIALIALATVGLAAVRLTSSIPKIPTAEVRRGVFTETLTLRGELKATRSVVLTAPAGAGGMSQILKLVRNGQQLKPGEVVIQFDASKLQQQLAQKQSDLKQAEAEIKQAAAQARQKEQKDITDVMKARFDVEAAKLEAQQQEILAKIDGEEKKLALADAEQKLALALTKLPSTRPGTICWGRTILSTRFSRRALMTTARFSAPATS